MERVGPFFQKLLAGLVMGIGAILPGVSGGVMAVSMGLYEPMIAAISHFFHDIRANIKFLLPILLGAAFGILATSGVLEWLMRNVRDQVLFLFIGLVAGGLPTLFQQANGKTLRLRGLLPLLLGIALPMLLFFFERGADVAPSAQTELHWLQALLAGGIIGLGTIIPGISGSFILIYLGYYQPLLSALKQLQWLPLCGAAAGFVLVALATVRLASWLFSHYHTVAYNLVMGFVIGSMVLIFPFSTLSIQWLLNLVLLTAGIGLSALINHGFGSKEGIV